MKYDFIAIGDIVSDEFIALKDVRVDTDEHEGDKGYDEICFRFGDKVEYKESVLIHSVGNSPNAAVSATRLGLKTALITDIGTDELGDQMIKALEGNNVDTIYVDRHEGMNSNHHYVLRLGAERTILINHAPYPYTLPKDMEPPKWLYFSSVGEHGIDYHFKIAKYVKEHPETKLAFQPGSFQISLGAEKLKEVYEASELFFCNKEESWRILGKESDNIKESLKGLRDLGPNIVCITDGPNGAYVYDGNEVWLMPMYPDPSEPVDRTGAGDAFSSTFTSALATDMDIPTALSWGPINSMNVVQFVGAQEGLLTKTQLEEFLSKAPENYKAQKIA